MTKYEAVPQYSILLAKISVIQTCFSWDGVGDKSEEKLNNTGSPQLTSQNQSGTE